MQGILILSITEHLAAANILVQNMAGEIKYKFVGIITNEGASVSGQRASHTLPPFQGAMEALSGYLYNSCITIYTIYNIL